jgi:iron complex outermembrane receptor protein
MTMDTPSKRPAGRGNFNACHWRGLGFLTSCSAAALVASFATGAWAQAAGPAASAAPVATPPAPGAATPAGSAPQANSIAELIVTATRRAERLQDVPFSVAAFSEAAIENAAIRDQRDLVLLTPGLRMDANNDFTSPTIRGVSTTVVGSYADPNVATYLDGIYQEFPVSAVFVLPDVQQVEVLKGPQGTLFGRNATGGAILITTREPRLSDSTGSFDLGYGNYNDVLAKGFFSTPLVADKLAASAAIYVENRDGWYHLLDYGGKRGGGLFDVLMRTKLRYSPNKDVDFTLTGFVSRRLDRTQGLDETLNGNSLYNSTPGAFVATKPYDYAGNLIPFTDARTAALSLRGTFAVGPGHFTTTSAVEEVDGPATYDNDATNLPIGDNYQRAWTRTYSEELLYTLDDTGPLHGTFGTYLYRNTDGHRVNLNPGSQGPTGDNGANVRVIQDAAEAWSIFGELTYDVTPKLSLTAGLRYSSETRRASGVGKANGLVTTTLPEQKHTWTSPTPRLSATYKFDRDHNVYATYSEGFKSGLFNALSFQVAPVAPEKIRSYEVGTKNEFSSLTLNLDAFYYDYTNLQVQSLVTQGAGFVSIVNNAATSKIYGAEANLSWQATRELRFDAGVSLVHARYNKFLNASAVVPNNATNTPSCNFQSYTPLMTGGYKGLFCDVSGKHMVRSPDTTVDIAVNYETDTPLGAVSASAVAYWASAVYYDAINFVKQSPYTTVNAQLSLKPAGHDNWKVTVYGTNLTDVRVFESVLISTSGISPRYAPPLQYGVKVGYAF